MARKYIKFSDGSFARFSDRLQHAGVAEVMPPEVVSAGFVGCMADGRPHCFGASENLGLESLPTDTEELLAWLRIG